MGKDRRKIKARKHKPKPKPVVQPEAPRRHTFSAATSSAIYYPRFAASSGIVDYRGVSSIGVLRSPGGFQFGAPAASYLRG